MLDDIPEVIINSYQPLWERDPINDPVSETDTEFPHFDYDTLINLCNQTITYFNSNSALIEISAPIVFVGDLHGSITDLIRIFHIFGVPPQTHYLFLGDYVDRGAHSLEVITLILAFFCKYPGHIYMIRGNHEFEHINQIYGFYQEIMANYEQENLWKKFQEVFSWLPLVAIVQNAVFAVHGGLSQLLTDLDTLKELKMPIPNYFNNKMISDLVWSDPVDTIKGFQINHRGSGAIFGPDVIQNFLLNNKLKLMIRAHQSTTSGFRAFGNFMGITVFSSSDYCKAIHNKCGVVTLKDDREMAFYSLDCESDRDMAPRAIMSLPVDGDVGLKKMFRTMSKPDLRACVQNTSGSYLADNTDSNSDDSSASSPLIMRKSFSVSEGLNSSGSNI